MHITIIIYYILCVLSLVENSQASLSKITVKKSTRFSELIIWATCVEQSVCVT